MGHGKPKPTHKTHAKTTKAVLKSMKTRLKTNPGGGYPHAPTPGAGMGGRMR